MNLSAACEGDSGSPVIRRISTSGRGTIKFYQQEFIVATGLDCRLPATIYTRVSQRDVLHWIQEVSGETKSQSKTGIYDRNIKLNFLFNESFLALTEMYS